MSETLDGRTNETTRKNMTPSPPAQHVTMHDVAALAQVSAMSVSRVLNGRPGVSEATKQAVTAAATTLGYRKNELARSLRPGERSRMIALVIGDISNPYYGIMAQAIEIVARKSGYAVVITSTNEDPETERTLIIDLVSRRVDGLIVVTCDDDHQYLASDIESGVAVVFVDRPPRGLDTDTVLVADRAGSYRATLKLLSRGHRSIGFIGDYEYLYTARERLAGYRDAMHKSSAETSFVQSDVHTRAEAEQVVTSWLAAANPPTAIIAGNNLIAAGVAAGCAPSTDLELVGFDFLPDSRLAMSIGYDVGELGARAAHRLFEQIEGIDRDPITDVIDLQLSVATDAHVAGPAKSRVPR